MCIAYPWKKWLHQLKSYEWSGWENTSHRCAIDVYGIPPKQQWFGESSAESDPENPICLKLFGTFPDLMSKICLSWFLILDFTKLVQLFAQRHRKSFHKHSMFHFDPLLTERTQLTVYLVPSLMRNVIANCLWCYCFSLMSHTPELFIKPVHCYLLALLCTCGVHARSCDLQRFGRLCGHAVLLIFDKPLKEIFAISR